MPRQTLEQMQQAARDYRHKDRVRERRFARMWALLVEGKELDEIQAELGIAPQQIVTAEARMWEQEEERVRKRTNGRVYLEYMLHQQQCLHLLDEVIVTMRAAKVSESKDVNAFVAAVRARSDLYDKLIKTGHDLGVIQKTPERREHLHGHVVLQNLTDDQLKVEIARELDKTNQLIAQSDEHTKILDMDPGSLHYELQKRGKSAEPAEEPVEKPMMLPGLSGKTNRTKANRVHGGRRVIRGPAKPVL